MKLKLICDSSSLVKEEYYIKTNKYIIAENLL